MNAHHSIHSRRRLVASMQSKPFRNFNGHTFALPCSYAWTVMSRALFATARLLPQVRQAHPFFGGRECFDSRPPKRDFPSKLPIFQNLRGVLVKGFSPPQTFLCALFVSLRFVHTFRSGHFSLLLLARDIYSHASVHSRSHGCPFTR